MFFLKWIGDTPAWFLKNLEKCDASENPKPNAISFEDFSESNNNFFPSNIIRSLITCNGVLLLYLANRLEIVFGDLFNLEP